MRRDPGAAFARALAFENAILDRLADETEPFRWGTALFCSTLPAIYDVNFVRVDKPDEEMDAASLISEADRLMAPRGLDHRKVVVLDETIGGSLAPAFTEAGYDTDRLLFMIHSREPERTASVDVDEIVAELHTRARERFNREEPYFDTEEAIEQMNTLARRLFEVTDKRCFAAYADGEIASVCELYSDGVTAQIEDVSTLEKHRSKGLATATVLRALHEAKAWGHELVFLVADADDWPRELYSKLGFEAVGMTYQFLRRPH